MSQIDSLFETGSEHPSAETVRLLESFGFKREAVRLWTAEKANTVLAACRREERIALRRADQTAREIDATDAGGAASWVERQEAARSIEQAAGDDPGELYQAIAYTTYCLTPAEAKRLAGYLVKLFRGQA